jgi:hypothetical protein
LEAKVCTMESVMTKSRTSRRLAKPCAAKRARK